MPQERQVSFIKKGKAFLKAAEFVFIEDFLHRWKDLNFHFSGFCGCLRGLLKWCLGLSFPSFGFRLWSWFLKWSLGTWQLIFNEILRAVMGRFPVVFGNTFKITFYLVLILTERENVSFISVGCLVFSSGHDAFQWWSSLGSFISGSLDLRSEIVSFQPLPLFLR